MRIVITGGTGQIGRALAADLISDKYEVIVLSRSTERTCPPLDGVHITYWDAKTAKGWVYLADGTQAYVWRDGDFAMILGVL